MPRVHALERGKGMRSELGLRQYKTGLTVMLRMEFICPVGDKDPSQISRQ